MDQTVPAPESTPALPADAAAPAEAPAAPAAPVEAPAAPAEAPVEVALTEEKAEAVSTLAGGDVMTGFLVLGALLLAGFLGRVLWKKARS
jgi:hypothetical protein